MADMLDNQFCRCERIGAAVRIDRTEGQCRDEHQCPPGPCPVADEFAGDAMRTGIHLMAAGLVGLVVPAPRGRD